MRSWLPVLALTLMACTSSVPETTTTAGGPTTTTATTTTTLGETSTSNAITSTSLPLVTIQIGSGGEVRGPDRFVLEVGEALDIWLVSEVADQLHVHGYDLFFDLEPGVPVRVDFVAEIPGVFEAELESSNLLVFELEVSG